MYPIRIWALKSDILYLSNVLCLCLKIEGWVGSFAREPAESRSTRIWGWIRWIRSLSDVAETWWDAGGIFACPDTDSFSARCQNREGHSPLAIHTSEFVHVLVLLAAGFALCFGESIYLT
jgi:hypothetical protein